MIIKLPKVAAVDLFLSCDYIYSRFCIYIVDSVYSRFFLSWDLFLQNVVMIGWSMMCTETFVFNVVNPIVFAVCRG